MSSRLLIFKNDEVMKYKNDEVQNAFLQLNLEFGDFFVIYFLKYSKTYLIDYLPRFTGFIDMFDTLLIIITLFLLPSLLVCLLTLRLSFNIKHLYFFLFSFVTDITDILKFRHSLPPPRLF